MFKVLFVCTANIYRSRFSEEVYNHFAIKNDLPTEAFSAGLKVGHFKTRKIYKPALDELLRLKIKPVRANEDSIHVNDIKLKNYDMIICMDEKEHKPMILLNSAFNGKNIIYWNIIDEPYVSANVSLPKCYKKIRDLISELSTKIA
jgi:protein-tyrosine phosphatase